MVLDVSLLNTQHYKARIKSKWNDSGKVVAPPSLHLGVVAIEKGTFRSLSTTVVNLLRYLML